MSSPPKRGTWWDESLHVVIEGPLELTVQVRLVSEGKPAWVSMATRVTAKAAGSTEVAIDPDRVTLRLAAVQLAGTCRRVVGPAEAALTTPVGAAK